LRVRAEVLRDGGPDLVAGVMDELRELHLGIPQPDPTAPRTEPPPRRESTQNTRGGYSKDTQSWTPTTAGLCAFSLSSRVTHRDAEMVAWTF
jgi:hypothetical protein